MFSFFFFSTVIYLKKYKAYNTGSTRKITEQYELTHDGVAWSSGWRSTPTASTKFIHAG
jgi:hypothetical protein